MITGIGTYVIEINGVSRCACFGDFSLVPSTSTRKHSGKSHATGISATSSADTVSKEWTLELTPAEFGIDTIELLTSTFAVKQDTDAFLEEYQQFTNQTNFYNLDNPGNPPQPGSNISVASAVSDQKYLITDGRNNLEGNRSFRGLIYADGLVSYSIELKNLKRIGNVNLSAESDSKLRFVVEEPIIRAINLRPEIQYSLLLAPIQTRYASQSQFVVFGQLDPNPGVVIDFSAVPVTIVFPFSTSSPITVTPNSAGFFSAFINTGSLIWPQTEEFIIKTADGELYTQQIEVESPTAGYSLTISAGSNSFANGQLAISGTTFPGSIVTVTSAGLVGSPISVQSDLDGDWKTTAIVVNSPVSPYTVTASSPGFSNVSASVTVSPLSPLTFNPVLTYQ